MLGNTSARYVVGDDYPIGLSVEEGRAILDTLEAQWGTAELVKLVVPDLAQDDQLVEVLARQWRRPHSRAAGALWRTLWDVDARDALSPVQAPTLIMHATESDMVPFSHGQYLADHIAGAQLVVRPGRATGFIPASYPATAEHIAEFLTGSTSPVAIDRVLTTILFSDIVASTSQLVDVGDEAWRRVLMAMIRLFAADSLISGPRDQTTGDGFVVSFDGLRGVSVARRPSPSHWRRSVSRSGSACTVESVRSEATTWLGSRSISPPGSVRWQDQGMSWSLER